MVGVLVVGLFALLGLYWLVVVTMSVLIVLIMCHVFVCTSYYLYLLRCCVYECVDFGFVDDGA